jgi:hypothetical protein
MVARDPEVLRVLLALHANPQPRILDVTFGLGTMWVGSGYEPWAMDIDPDKAKFRVGDFRDLGWSRDAEWDVVVFDPPHITDAGANSALAARYGLRGIKGDSISHLFPHFLGQVGRILRPGGIVLAKIADQVHGGAHQWQMVDFVNAARAAGLTPCDLVVKADPSAGGIAGLWKRVLHTRNSHCYWIVLRVGSCSPVRAATPAST